MSVCVYVCLTYTKWVKCNILSSPNLCVWVSFRFFFFSSVVIITILLWEWTRHERQPRLLPQFEITTVGVSVYVCVCVCFYVTIPTEEKRKCFSRLVVLIILLLVLNIFCPVHAAHVFALCVIVWFMKKVNKTHGRRRIGTHSKNDTTMRVGIATFECF